MLRGKSILTLTIAVVLGTGFTGMINAGGNDNKSSSDGKYESGQESRNTKKYSGRKPGRVPMHLLQNLSEKEREQLKKLYKENRKEFYKVIRQKTRELRKKAEAERKKVLKLAAQYRNAKTDEEKKKYLKQIEDYTRKEFNRKMAQNQKMLNQTERRLKELRNRYERRKKAAEQIIQERVKDLTRDPELEW